MIKIVLLLFLIGHVIGDFYFQSKKLAQRKDEYFSKLVLHSLIYLCSMVAAMIPVFSGALLKWAFIVSFFHFAVDGAKFIIKKKLPLEEKLDVIIFFIDQAIHILVIVFSVVALSLSAEFTVNFSDWIQYLLSSLQMSVNVSHILSWILIVLIIIQPTSITIRKVLYQYKPAANEENGHPNAGAFIGILERCIILLLLSVGQYGAIGFVLTAKSVARYNKIAEEPQFAEYYLLGTLLSTMLSIAVYLMIF